MDSIVNEVAKSETGLSDFHFKKKASSNQASLCLLLCLSFLMSFKFLTVTHIPAFASVRLLLHSTAHWNPTSTPQCSC